MDESFICVVDKQKYNKAVSLEDTDAILEGQSVHVEVTYHAGDKAGNDGIVVNGSIFNVNISD